MVLAVFGGSFNPAHIGHLTAAQNAMARTMPDKLLIIPAGTPPHKDIAQEPGAGARLELARLCFAGLEGAQVSDLEISRGGKSYTADTLRLLMAQYPAAEILLYMGSDMLESFETWYDFLWILQNVTIVVMRREDFEEEKLLGTANFLREKYNARIETVLSNHRVISSTALRELLKAREGREFFAAGEYEYIIAGRLYGAKPELGFLREKGYAMLHPKRVRHVIGCEKEAVKLASFYGSDETQAAEAAILHDITKRLGLAEQLKLCKKYDIMTDALEATNGKLLHSKTGAAIARAQFGVSDAVFGAINWHTTGRADMTLSEKILYVADYIEETRHFEGIEKLRRLAYEDIDKALVLGLEMSIKEVLDKGYIVHRDTYAALKWYKGETA